LVCLLFSVLGCSLSGEAASLTPTTPDQNSFLTQVTFAPVVTITSAPPVVTGTPAATLDSCAAPAEKVSSQYQVETNINPEAHTVRVRQYIIYRNQTGRTLNDLVFNIDANRAPGVFKLEALEGKESGAFVRSELDGPRLHIDLKEPLPHGCTVSFRMQFSLHVPLLNEALMRYLSATDHELNLGYWLPEIAPWVGGEWRTPKASQIGEYIASEMANFDVTASLESGDGVIDPEMEIIGPGTVERIDSRTWHFTQHESRVFSLLVSNSMAHMSTQNADGITLDLYYLLRKTSPATPDLSVGESDPLAAPKYALEVARKASEVYARRYGRLPYARLVIIEGEYPDGMELSGLVYVSHQWFATYRGSPQAWLTLITAHEIAHQWWYSVVANDQAEHPYLDEALAIYSEALFLEATHPELVEWWWIFRIRTYQPAGNVDANVYGFLSARLYINAVYLRGALMLQEIRTAIGDSAFFMWLSTYFKNESDRIATPIDFWASLSRADYLAISKIRARYLNTPDPLGIESALLTATVQARTPTPTRRPSVGG